MGYRHRLRSNEFFRQKLLRLNSRSEIEEFLVELETEQAKMLDHIAELNWLQRGGATWGETMNLSLKERQAILRQAEIRMKAAKETRMAII